MARGSTAVLQIGLIAILFFGGGFCGSALAKLLAPGSFFAEAVGFFMLPLAMLAGLTIWFWTALTVMLSGFFFRLYRNRKKPLREAVQASGVSKAKAPPGSFFFVPVCGAIGFLAGVLIGLTSSSTGFFSSVFWTTITGIAYGLLLWRLAKSGILPFPEEA